MAIFAFLTLIGVGIWLMFFGRRSGQTFTHSEWEAFARAEQVKKDLQKVQKMIGPAKPDTSLSIGAFLPKKPEETAEKK